MISEFGYFSCDFCGGETGIFNDETGNHVTCEEVVKLKAELATLRQQSEWIPVSDRLPEYGYRVEVISRGEVEIGWVNNIHGVKIFNLCNVTHWRPLQEPPTKG